MITEYLRQAMCIIVTPCSVTETPPPSPAPITGQGDKLAAGISSGFHMGAYKSVS